MKVSTIGQRVILDGTFVVRGGAHPYITLDKALGTVTDIGGSIANVEVDGAVIVIDVTADPRVEPFKSAEAELRSIHNFAKAVVSRGDSLWKEAMEEFDRTGESGYKEGHAAGFSAAAKLILDFIEFDENQSKARASARCDCEADLHHGGAHSESCAMYDC